jgi:hypothetical protein
MFTIIWNPIGFYVVDRLPNDTKMNSDYFVTNILISLEQIIFPCRRASHGKRLVVSVNNCSVHTSRGSTDWLEKHGIHRMPDQFYSPNLATSIHQVPSAFCFQKIRKSFKDLLGIEIFNIHNVHVLNFVVLKKLFHLFI